MYLKGRNNQVIQFDLYLDQEVGFTNSYASFKIEDNKKTDDDIPTDEEYLFCAKKRCKRDLIEAINDLKPESKSEAFTSKENDTK